MIAYDLDCDGCAHRFEGWFNSIASFEDQQARGLVACPVCGANAVTRAVMAPALTGRRTRDGDTPDHTMASGVPADLVRKLAALQRAMLEKSDWVGPRFAEEARAMHYGEREARTIHGQATPAEAKALKEEGVPLTPLPFPITPPEAVN